MRFVKSSIKSNNKIIKLLFLHNLNSRNYLDLLIRTCQLGGDVDYGLTKSQVIDFKLG